MGEHEGPRAPRVTRPEYRDPTEGVDWTREPFHRAFVRQHVYRGGTKVPAGVIVWIYVATIAGLLWGLWQLVQLGVRGGS